MTRLTLYWHLKAIVEGVPDDCYTTGMGKYHPQTGEVCTAISESLAFKALHADDIVSYLDSVSHDPVMRASKREDAKQLLDTHILERRVISGDENRTVIGENDEVRNEFVKDNSLPKASMRPGYWNGACCDNCKEQEVLYDIDKQEARCHCGEKQFIPSYP